VGFVVNQKAFRELINGEADEQCKSWICSVDEEIVATSALSRKPNGSIAPESTFDGPQSWGYRRKS
jgi:hypothetical protein